MTMISLAEAAVQVRSGRVTPLELLDRCLGQIDRLESRLHAWVVVDEAGARQAAAEMTGEAERGQFRGPLHGLPIGIKDIFDVEGMPTQAGSPLRAGHRADADAPLVAALRRAGAVILGKTVTVEFACFDPSRTRNPWNMAHTPGGSSSGSAAAVAVGMCLGALGTQTGGSLVRPSTYCGIATFKPTFGRLSTEGVVPVSYHLDHPGPMARRVADLRLMQECLLAGPGGGPAELLDDPGPRQAAPPGTARIVASATAGPRLGLLETFFLDEASPAIQEATRAAVDQFRRAGAVVETVAVPKDLDFGEVRPVHRTIMAVEAAAYHRRDFAAHREAYGPLITELLDEGLRIPGVDYAAALAWQRAWRQRVGMLWQGIDALVVPSTDTTAPATLATTGTPKFQAPWSCAGVPLASIPCGVAADGLPAAVQIIGPHNSDARILDVAAWCEAALEFDAVPPMLAETRV